MAVVLVTGASRGLGAEFVRQFVARGDVVFAAMRSPETAPEPVEGATPLALDVTDPASVAAAVEAVEAAGRLDLLLNNAGVYPGREGGEALGTDRLGELTDEALVESFRVNAVAPLLLAQAFLPLLRRSDAGKVVTVSSRLASISLNDGSFGFGYSMAKAAMNTSMRSLAGRLREEGIAAAPINPGWVKTRMGGEGATMPADRSVRGMIAAIEGLTVETTGTFLGWDGRETPW